MNVWNRNARSWRKARKRAVSPIIATILLVAITVVLAAVLYVLISGLTHGPGGATIGSAFGAGNPTAGTQPSTNTGTTSPGSCAAGSTTLAVAMKPSEWQYTLTVESSSVTFGQLGFEVKGANGVVSIGAGAFYVTNPAGQIVACQTFAAGVGFATTGGFVYPTAGGSSTTTSVSTLDSIIIDTGSAAAANPWAGQGNTFNAFGVGSYSGTTQPITLP
jgi:flagellin-like protein